MKDLSFIPPSQKRSRYRLVRRRTLLTLAIIATLATSAVVVQQWVWSGQYPHKTLDVDKAINVVTNPKEDVNKRNAAALWLQDKIIDGIDALKAYQKTATTTFKPDADGIIRRVKTAAGGK